MPDTALSEEATDLKALRDAVVDAAAVSSGLWFSYLFLILYLAIAVGSITHSNLFLEDPVRLPFLNVDLPIVSFFVVGPLLFLIAHAYVLLHCVLYSDKVGAFHAQLQTQVHDEAVRAGLRRQLPNNIFVQVIAGPREVRTGVIGWMLRLISRISLVLGPMALLVLFQFQFLPYHPKWQIAWWQRATVGIDLVLLWTLWPSVEAGKITWLTLDDLRWGTALPLALYRFRRLFISKSRGSRRIGWRIVRRVARRGTAAMWIVVSFAPLLLVFAVSTYPGESMYRRLRGMALISPLHEILFGGPPNQVESRARSWFSDRLVLTDQSFVDADKVEKVAITRSLRGRDLTQAVLNGSDLRKVDFTGSKLNGAQFEAAKLQGARFECADIGKKGSGSGTKSPDLGANDTGVDEGCVQANGANFNAANLEGVHFDSAELEGASFLSAQLQGAGLGSTKLQGALFNTAKLEGADMGSANLEGASLDGAELQGVNLGSNADLQGASLSRAKVWRMRGTSVDNLAEITDVDRKSLPWDKLETASYRAWLDRILNEIPPGERRDQAQASLSTLDPTPANEPTTPWSASTSIPIDNGQQTEKLEAFLEQLACSSKDTAPYVARGLLNNGRLSAVGARITQVAIAFHLPDCRGTEGFTDDDWNKLQQFTKLLAP